MATQTQQENAMMERMKGNWNIMQNTVGLIAKMRLGWILMDLNVAVNHTIIQVSKPGIKKFLVYESLLLSCQHAKKMIQVSKYCFVLFFLCWHDKKGDFLKRNLFSQLPLIVSVHKTKTKFDNHVSGFIFTH